MHDSDKEAGLTDYQKSTIADVEACVARMGCQPILFIGSGLSKRMFSGPNWDELLRYLAEKCPLIDKDYAYYKQTFTDPTLVGEEFARLYQKWAWSEGKGDFPPELFEDGVPAEAYIKYHIAKHLEELTPKALTEIADTKLGEEVAALQSIRPHALITTNYDRFLELVFPDYQPVLGQSIIQGTQVLLGEIFKIHGCVSNPSEMVFTKNDYTHFMRKKKYLSAKLLTYFSEHPLLLIGYSASDLNIQAILSDIDECLPTAGQPGTIIQNIYMLEWQKNPVSSGNPPTERLIQVEEGRAVRIKVIQASEFGWVFRAFGGTQPLNPVSPKVLRSLLHRSYELVRHDIPRKAIQADFAMLERSIETEDSFAKIFGIATISASSSITAEFPYTLSLLAEKVTGTKDAHWGKVQPYLDRLTKEQQINIKQSDNRYHSAIRIGKKSVVHKYSDAFLDLLLLLKAGKEYAFQP